MMKFLVTALAVVVCQASAAGAIWYVDDSAPAGGNGTSWASSFNNLQAALTAAAANDEVRIGQGTYKPAGPGGSRSATFTINKSLIVHGGYYGYPNPTFADAFTTAPNATILSGDLNGDDGAEFANTGENSFRVLTVSSPATSVTIERLSVRAGNGAVTGAGMIVIPNSITVKVDRCDFRSNQASSYAGGVDHNGSINSIYSRCVFFNNTAVSYGGGLSLSGGNGARVINCGFYGNKLTGTQSGTGGGGIWINGQSTLYNCVFSVNSTSPANPASPQGGGGAIATGAGPITIWNCTLYGNYGSNGRGLYATSAVPAVANTVFANDYTTNEISGSATTTYCASYSDALLPGTANINFYNLEYTLADPDGYDNILGTPDDDFTPIRGYPGSPIIDRGSAGAVLSDIADLDGDADFAEQIPFDFRSSGRRYSDPVMPDAVGAGTPAIDIGAYEAYASPSLAPLGSVVYVSPQGGAEYYISAGTSWNDAFAIPQNAMYLAQAFPQTVQEIRFSGGTYRPSPTAGVYLSASLYDRSNLLIRGGFAGPEFANPDARDVNAYASILDGDVQANDPIVVADPFIAQRSDNQTVSLWLYNCTNITVDGLRFRNGGGGSAAGGIRNDSVGTVVRNCTVERCYDFAGGFFSGYDGPPSPSMTLVNCDVLNCWGEYAGAAHVQNGTLSLINCRFVGNKQIPDNLEPYFDHSAGAVGIDAGCTVTATNCLMASNTGVKGGAIGGEGTLTLSNCTIANNTAAETGGGVWKAGTAPTVNNCVISGNIAPSHAQLFPTNSTVQNSLIQGGWTGATNRDGDPRFTDANGADNTPGNLDDDYRVLPSSAAIDIGSAALLPADIGDVDADSNTSETLPLDLALTTRNIDGDLNGTATPDAGCYEFAVGSILNTTTGITFPTIAAAMAAANSGEGIAAVSSAFSGEPTINFNGKAVSITSTAGITQNAGGIYTLADGALMSTATAGAQTLSLSGELRVPVGASATAAGNIITLTSTGRLNVLAGATLNLNAGTLSGSGAHSLFPDSTLLLTGSSSTTGALNAQAGSTLNIGGNLTLGGITTLQGASVIAGATTVSSTTNWSGSTFSVASLSIGAAGRFTGSGSIYGATSNSGRIYTVGNTLFVGNLTNNTGGIVTIQIGTATLIGSLVNNGTINGLLSNPPSPPPDADDSTIEFYRNLQSSPERTASGDGFSIRGDYTAGAASSLSLPDAVWKLTVAGAYDVAINNNANYDMRQAELVMAKPDTGGSNLEAMSLDRGAVLAGLDRTLASSFPIGTLRIGAGGVVTIIDSRDNANDGQASCEAVYADTLVIEPGATLNNPSCRVYYRTLSNSGTVTTPSNLIQIPPPCVQDLNHDGTINTLDLILLLQKFGQNVPLGTGPDIVPDGQVNTLDLILLLQKFGQNCT